MNVRLVDVDVSALDARGQPATGLSLNDFEVYDNGRKQILRSLSRVSGTASRAANGAVASDTLAAQPVQIAALETSTILLLDESSVGFADLNYARQQLLKFLDRLPDSEPVGLYIRIGP